MLEAGNSAPGWVPAMTHYPSLSANLFVLQNGTVAPKSMGWEVGFSEVQRAQLRAGQRGATTLSHPIQYHASQWVGPALTFPQPVMVPANASVGLSRISVKIQLTRGGWQLKAALLKNCKGFWEHPDFTWWAPGLLGDRKRVVWGHAPEHSPVPTPPSPVGQRPQRSSRPFLPLLTFCQHSSGLGLQSSSPSQAAPCTCGIFLVL